MRQIVDVHLRTRGHLKLFRVPKRICRFEFRACGGGLSVLDQTQPAVVMLVPRTRRCRQQDREKENVHAQC